MCGAHTVHSRWHRLDRGRICFVTGTHIVTIIAFSPSSISPLSRLKTVIIPRHVWRQLDNSTAVDRYSRPNAIHSCIIILLLLLLLSRRRQPHALPQLSQLYKHTGYECGRYIAGAPSSWMPASLGILCRFMCASTRRTFSNYDSDMILFHLGFITLALDTRVIINVTQSVRPRRP